MTSDNVLTVAELQTVGSPIFDKLILTTNKGGQFDLVPMLSQLNIYEDIFSPVLTGDVTIQDNLGIFDNSPLTGQEKITSLIYTVNYSKSNEKINFLLNSLLTLKNLNF